MYEDNNVTKQELLNKKKNRFKISDERNETAAGYALMEAKKWDSAAMMISKNKSLTCQTCVNALFSIELYLKCILFSLNINVTTKKYGHNIFEMYNDLDICLQEKIKDGIKIDKVINKWLFNEVITFNTFEDELKFISNDFMFLRYEYEKFINGIQIITLTDFIMLLKDNCRKIATNLYEEMLNNGKEKEF